MAGSLVLIEKTTLGSGTASVTLDGIDSTYDVYMIRVSNVQPVTDNKNIICNITKSGSADTTSNYDIVGQGFISTGAFGDEGGNNASSFTIGASLGNGTGEKLNGLLYLYNFASSSEYSMILVESCSLNLTPAVTGYQSAVVHTVTSASDGIKFAMESSVNINTGAEFALYGLKK